MRSTALEPTKGRSSDHPDAGTRPAAKEREEEGLRTGTHATAPTALVVRSQGLRTEAANRERLTAPLEAAWSSDRARREMKPWLRKEAARTFGSAQGRTFGSGRGRTFGSGQRPQGAAERSPHAPRTFGDASDGARPALRGRFDETFGSSRSDRAETETTPTGQSLRVRAGRTFGFKRQNPPDSTSVRILSDSTLIETFGSGSGRARQRRLRHGLRTGARKLPPWRERGHAA